MPGWGWSTGRTRPVCEKSLQSVRHPQRALLLRGIGDAAAHAGRDAALQPELRPKRRRFERRGASFLKAFEKRRDVAAEIADGIAALIRLAEHFLCGYDRHDIYLRYIKYMDTLFCTSALYQCFRAASTAEILFFLPFAEKKLARL